MKRQAEFTNLEKTRSLEYLKNESVELSLTYCGYEECDAGSYYEPRRRDYFMLFMINKGKGIFEIEGERKYLEEKDMLLIFPGMKYAIESSLEQSWSFMWIGFTGMKAEESVMHVGFSRERLIQKTEYIEKMYGLIESLLTKREVTFANNLRRNGLLKTFFADLIEEHIKKMSEEEKRQIQSKEASKYIRNAINYIAENYNTKIKVNELADYVGVNRSYLASSFKKTVGCSPKEYLLSLRMEKAKSLLETTDMPINTISSSVGYTDQLAFSRMFKQYTGKSPKAYREENKF